ncbi:hypothetical protein [Pseudarthrobacter sp. YALA5]|uniref:hypothetical protein n=1 Tax=Pseudarthrobacter sp. DSP2-3-2b1 TaxID=2804661 RepID=UPI001039A861
MRTSFKALVVPARLTHPVHIGPVELDLAAWQRVAAGEIGFIAGRDWHVYLNNGGSRSLPNVRAEVLIREAGVDLDETIHGTALFLGDGRPGETVDAPRHLIRLAEQLFDMPLAA